MYIPPFKISADAINKIAEISAQIERYAIRLEQKDALQLRKVNRIKTIHSSLAIEGNGLTESEVCDIIDGKMVVAPLREIQEVKNAIKTYELYPQLNPYNEKDLLRAHSTMMAVLIDGAGHYRRGGVGVFGEIGLVHLAPPADAGAIVDERTFNWLKSSKSSICLFALVYFIMNLNLSTLLWMVTDAWGDFGSRLFLADYTPCLNIYLLKTWCM